MIASETTTGVIWLCACVRYFPYRGVNRGVGTCASVLKSVFWSLRAGFHNVDNRKPIK